jgi:hypothetical protein
LHNANQALEKHGLVPLQPDQRNLIIEVTVSATPRKAHALVAQARALKQLYPKRLAGSLVTRQANLFISYRDRPHARQVVIAALGQLTASCKS